MAGAVFIETLRRGWRSMIYWGIGMGLYGGIIILMLPDVNVLKQAADLITSLPPFIVKMVGGDDITFMTTPAGFLATKFFLFAPIMFGIYVIRAGLDVTSNEEDRGIMDVTLSLPVRRWRIVVERMLGYAVLLSGIVTITFLSLLISDALSPNVNIASSVLFPATINILPSMLLLLAVTVLVGAAAPRRGVALAIATIFLIGSYVIDLLGSMATGSLAASLRTISFYSYYDSSGVMQHGLTLGNVLILLAVAADLRCARALLLRATRHRRIGSRRRYPEIRFCGRRGVQGLQSKHNALTYQLTPMQNSPLAAGCSKHPAREQAPKLALEPASSSLCFPLDPSFSSPLRLRGRGVGGEG